MSDRRAASGLPWRAERRGCGRRPAVVLGSGAQARRVAEAVESKPELKLSVTDVLEVSGSDALAEMLLRFRDHVVVVAPKPDEVASIGKLLPALTVLWPKIGIVVPTLNTLMVGNRTPVLLTEDTMLLWSRNRFSQRGPRIAKRAVDIVGSALGILLFSPLFLTIWVCNALTGQPAFYGHRRVGRFGRSFACLKFRTMTVNASEALDDLLARDPDARREWHATYKLKNDPRVTRLGALLRRTSLDELPQLWNVLKGDMSLVGPRPIVQDELRYYGDQAQSYLNVKPGLTGVWQVSGRNDTSYDERVSLDRWYVSNWCLWYDVVILFKTLGVMLRRSGAY